MTTWDKDVPRVPLPPNLISPKRLNGTLNVVMSDVTCRITMTLVGSPGNNLELMASRIFGRLTELSICNVRRSATDSLISQRVEVQAGCLEMTMMQH
jgi:hypothetical protein